MSQPQPRASFLGITVLGDFIVSEGVEAVLDNVCRAGATAVACNPTVTAPADEKTGSFQPPDDAGSSPRVFDRPIFGKHSLWVRSGVSYHPREEFYRDSPYTPRQTNDLTEQYGSLIGDFIESAIKRGLQVFLQLGAVQPSGLLDEDRPRLPNGTLPEGRMADTGSLASDAIRAYNRAYVRDLLQEYPQVSGFRPDWPEYPCYTFGEVFQDFSPHVESRATAHGFDFPAIREGIGSLYDHLRGELAVEEVRKFNTTILNDGDETPLTTRISRHAPTVAEWLRLKAALSVDLLQHWRDAIDDAGGKDKQLVAHAFMPPYSLLTGFDFPKAAAICDAIAPKLYTMHWSLMVKFWGEPLLEKNPGLNEADVVSALVRLMDIADALPQPSIADYGYPNPDEPHPVSTASQLRKIGLVRQLVLDAAKVYPLVHGYGPVDDFERRLKLVTESGADGLWINRYGYLSDEKLRIIAEAS